MEAREALLGVVDGADGAAISFLDTRLAQSAMFCFGYVRRLGAPWHWLLLLVSAAMAMWSQLGWLLRVAYTVARGTSDMPLVPGWYEVCVSMQDDIPSGLLLTGGVVFTYYFGHWFFARHAELLRSATAAVQRDFPCTAEFIECRVVRHQRVALFWALASAVLGRFVSVLTTATSNREDDFLRTEPAGSVMYDFIVTFVSFLLQFGVVAFVCVVVAHLCTCHEEHLRAFGEWLDSRGGETEITDIMTRHREMLRLVQRTAERVEIFVTGYLVLFGLGLVFTILRVFLASDDTRTGHALRIIYCVGLGGPLIYALFHAALVTERAQDVTRMSYELKPRAVVAESTFLNSYFVAVAASPDNGFRVFGFLVEKRLLARVAYLLGIVLSSLVQFSLSRKAHE